MGYAQTDSLSAPIVSDSVKVGDGLVSDSLSAADSSSTAVSDSIKIPSQSESNALESTIYYSADDSIKTDINTKTAYLYGNASIKYTDVEIHAAEIQIEWEKNIVFAKGRTDSTGRYIGRPLFIQAGEKMAMDSVRSNTQTKKALIYGIETQQGEGYLTGDIAKRTEEAIYLREGHYTTCNMKHPHFYINARKLKVIPNDKAVCGPFNLVIEDVPTPLGFVLGYFPMMNKRKSGLIFPQLGEDVSRGFFMSQGGYYWAVNDYLGLRTVADLYANGSYRVTTTATYIDRYRYNGNAMIDFSRVKSGFDFSKPPRQFRLTWAHNSKQRKNSSFRANVNISSAKYFKTVSYNPTILNTNATSSGITYFKQFGRSPFNMTATLSGDQNVNATSSNSTEPQAIYNAAPQVSFNMIQQYPFKRKVGGGRKWYEKISIGYTANADYRFTNRSTIVLDPTYPAITKDTIYEINPGNLNKHILPDAKWTATHRIPLNASFKILKNISLNPNFTYNEFWYQKKINWQYDTISRRALDTDKSNGFYRAGTYSTGASLTTNVYGMYSLRSKVIQKIRHTMSPSVGMTFAPEFDGDPYYQKIPQLIDSRGREQRFFRYVGAATPTQKQSTLNFGVSNALEAKVRNRKDTAGTETKKIKLLDNLTVNSAYNFAADSMNFNYISVSARTLLFNKINLNYNATLDPYMYVLDSARMQSTGKNLNYQRRVNKYSIKEGHGLYKTERYNILVGVSLMPPKKNTKSPATTSNDEETMLNHTRNNPEMYVDFNMPWNLNINYNYYYTKIGFDEPTIVQSVQLNGELKLTEKWKLTATTAYDLEKKSISTSRFDLYRDLHCWQMSFSASPYGSYKFYFFTISAKSSILQELKLNKRSQGFNSNY